MRKVNLIRQLFFATVRTRVIGPCAKRLELPLSVWSGVFFLVFGFVSGGKFWCFFRPFFQKRKFELYSTWSNYSSFYGMEIRGWVRLLLGVIARANLEEWGYDLMSPDVGSW